MIFITNIRDPRTDGMGNIIPGRETMPERYPVEWIREDFSGDYAMEEKDLQIVINRDGNCLIGEPTGSEYFTSGQLKERGMVGLYKD